MLAVLLAASAFAPAPMRQAGAGAPARPMLPPRPSMMPRSHTTLLAAGTYGLSERQCQRLDNMLTKEEPLIEEIVGLQLLCAAAFCTASRRFHLSSTLVLIGITQIAPLLAFGGTDGCRAAGWHAFATLRGLLGMFQRAQCAAVALGNRTGVLPCLRHVSSAVTRHTRRMLVLRHPPRAWRCAPPDGSSNNILPHHPPRTTGGDPRSR